MSSPKQQDPTVGLVTLEARESAFLAPYAMHSAMSAGRKYSEPDHPYRGPFQRDRDRITHSAAYRRLSSKTQVFTGELGDYHRTRLTHTLEVASVSRTLGRSLALNEDLVEALALVHDLGHPPFGHAGEDALDDCLRSEGGFSHNRQALRIVEELEARYPDFPGLNLTKEVLEGQTARLSPKLQWDDAQSTLPETGKDYAIADESLRPLLEVQVVEAADSVAYDTHDADDALELELLTLDELLGTALWAEAARRVRRRYAAIEGVELRRAVLHELIDWQVSDLLARARVRLADGSVTTPSDARRAEYLIAASPELAEQKEQLEAFLHERVYRHPNVLAHRRQAQDLLLEMFDGFVRRPELLPDRFLARSRNVGLRRSIGDYLAGMTDRFAQRERDRLLSASIRG